MKIAFENKLTSIIISGDIHEEIIPLVFKINEQHKITNSLIIVAGDSGIGFYKDGYYRSLFKKADIRLKSKNNTLLLLRGNHDNPDKWNDYEPFKEYWQDGNSNIRLIKDYTVISAETDNKKHNIICVGGAISIDRIERKPGVDFWPNESFVYDHSKVDSLTNITDIVTHSAPDFCEPILKSGIAKWIVKDETLEVDCNKERADHTLLYNKLKEKNAIRTYCYGHMHYSHREYIDNVKFTLLNVMELIEL